MANRKKLRKRFFNGQVSIADLSEDEAKYLNKYIRKLERNTQIGQENAMITYKQVPCQKWKGKIALVPINARIVTGEDGLLYINDVEDNNLIVSDNWTKKEEAKKIAEQARKAKERKKQNEETEKAVTELKPTKLGEE